MRVVFRSRDPIPARMRQRTLICNCCRRTKPMDSGAKISKSHLGLPAQLGTRMMPYLAILRHDLGTLWSSRLVRLWLAGTALLTFILIISNWSPFPDAPLIAAPLFPYLVFP